MDVPRLEKAIRSRDWSEIAALAEAALTGAVDGRLAGPAVRHPLGFVCLPVHRTARHGVCVHVWPDKRKPPALTTSPFHCHSWDLLSFVLYGTVGNALVDVTPGSTYQMFDVHISGDGDFLEATGKRVDARAQAPEYWSAGQYYELPSGDFHASVMPDELGAATIIVGRHHASRPDVSLGGLDTPSHPVTRKPCKPDEANRLVRQVLSRLTQQVPADDAALVGSRT